MKFSRLAVMLGLSVSLTVFAAQEPAITPLSEPEPAPEFKLEDLQGHLHTLSDYQGQVLIVNFWATWCPPCIEEIPSLERAQEHLRPYNAQVLAVNAGESKAQVENFLDQFPVRLTLLLDTDMEVASAWSVMGLPTTYVVDATGNIVFRVLGDRQWDDPAILSIIRQLAEADSS